MYKYKLFVDSIVLKIPYLSHDKQYEYNNILNYLDMKGYKNTTDISDKYTAKFKFMYLLRDIYGKNLLDVYSFTTTANNKSIFFVYALKHGVYIELNGLVQYENDYRQEKYSLLNNIWNSYACSISKLDITIDVEVKFHLLKLYDNKLVLLNKCKKSNKTVHYYCEGTSTNANKQRKLKAYYKSTQRYRDFPLAIDLSRIEMTLKSQKLNTLTDIDGFTHRVSKEFSKYIIKVDKQEIVISTVDIMEMFKSLFSTLEAGKNTKRYSNYYKNIETKISSMKLAWLSYEENISVNEFVKSHSIASTVLKKYRKFYKNSQVL